MDAAKWTHLISPNAYTTEIVRRAFGYKGKVIESGQPRNDPLNAPDAGEQANVLRRALGIPHGRRVALYAPTFRDHRFIGRGYRIDLMLDTELLERRLGSDWLLLVRAHPAVLDRLEIPNPGFAWDMSAYHDIGDLLLVADVLVTDYSSVLVDFAVTRKPILLFAYDLERYREVRGLYLDPSADAPGPLLRSSEEIADALAGSATVSDASADRYDLFVKEFCQLEDGNAAARVIHGCFR